MDNRTDDQLAQILWDYNCLEQPLQASEVILVLGSNDIRVAQRGAELYLAGMAPLLIFSGNLGRLTQSQFNRTEAEVFADEAIKVGVPVDHILLETKSTNTGENIIYTQQLIADQGLSIKSFIVVQKPYMLRRAYATFMKQWPGQEFKVTGPQISYQDYPNQVISKELLINIMVGDTQRIKVYADKGFQIAQDMPDQVWAAFKELVRRGYTHHLVS